MMGIAIVLIRLSLPLLTRARPCGVMPGGVMPKPSGMEMVRERISHRLMEENVSEDRISTLIHTLRNDGSWPGIDYVDTSRTGFQQSEHMSNLVSMSRAYRKEGRSEESRVGKEGVSTCRSRWSP